MEKKRKGKREQDETTQSEVWRLVIMEKHVQEHPACLKTWVCTPPVRMKHHKPESWKKRGTLAGVVVVNTEHSLFVFVFVLPCQH